MSSDLHSSTLYHHTFFLIQVHTEGYHTSFKGLFSKFLPGLVQPIYTTLLTLGMATCMLAIPHICYHLGHISNHLIFNGGSEKEIPILPLFIMSGGEEDYEIKISWNLTAKLWRKKLYAERSCRTHVISPTVEFLLMNMSKYFPHI